MKKTGYLPLLILTVLFTLAGLSTVLPLGTSKPCLLGYRAHCTFTPVSTLICFAGSAVTCIVRKRKFTTPENG